MISYDSIIMGILGFAVLFGGLAYFLRIAMKSRRI